MRFTADLLRAVLTGIAPEGVAGFVVALSGGADSASLLAALAQPQEPPERGVDLLPVRAVHVDHGLQPSAAGLRRACEDMCRRFDVELKVITVTVPRERGASLEAAARDARYRALAGDLESAECLLTAHHAEDQAETLLLQLLRGTGLKGLCAMPACRAFGNGWHVRPLLDVARSELRDFGAAAGIVAMDDPMNDDARFDRNHLRLELWPRIEARWPGAARSLSRTARHLSDAQALLEGVAAREMPRLRDGAALSVPALRALPRAQQQNLIRCWIMSQGAEAPAEARLNEALRQVKSARSDQSPAVIWGAHALRRYRGRLFLTPSAAPRVRECEDWAVRPGATLPLGSGLGTLHWSLRPGGLDPERLPPTLNVRRRLGGETLRPEARARTQTLQHLCQSHGILPWMRDALPLIHAGRDLVAVGDLWRDARWCAAPDVAGYACEWLEAPVLV